MSRDLAGAAQPLVSPSGRVRAVPPAQPGGYWRLSGFDEEVRARVAQTTGGRTRATALVAMADLDRRLAATAPAGRTAVRCGQLADFFVDPARPKCRPGARRAAAWSLAYTVQVERLLACYIRPVVDTVPLARLSTAHSYAVLDRCPTDGEVEKVRRLLSAICTVGFENGFLRADQLGLHRVSVPRRPSVRLSRRPAAAGRRESPALLQPAECPSGRQVAALAAGLPQDAAWPGLVFLLAYVGLRIGELLALTAHDVLASPAPRQLPVTWQLVEVRGHGKVLTAPKSRFARHAAVCECTPQGFALWDWLGARAEQALAESDTGRNPRALIAPAPAGGWWSYSNFRGRRFVPAATAAGWEQLRWQGPVRRRIAGQWTRVTTDRRDFRHTLHALRHHYATTARDVWGWTGAELCASGGWADEAFVLSRYYGASAEVYATAVAKQLTGGRR